MGELCFSKVFWFSLCPGGFLRITVDFPMPPLALGRCIWLARLTHLVVIFSRSYVLPLQKLGGSMNIWILA